MPLKHGGGQESSPGCGGLEPCSLGCELSSFYELSHCGLGSNSEGSCQETQGLEGNAAGDSIGRALPSVDVGAEPHRHIPP